MLRLNPYAQVIQSDNNLTFYQPPTSSANTAHISIKNVDGRNKIINTLLSGIAVEENDCIDQFGTEETRFMVQNNILTETLPDVDSVLSRTKAYYSQYLYENQTEKIRRSSILVLGCGGIGSAVSWLLASLGVKQITIVDYDVVELSNLNRMFMFSREDINRKKTDVLREKLRSAFPNTEIEQVDLKINSKEVLHNICRTNKYDLIIKALDSPSEFPKWLDVMCKSMKMKYVTGITLRDRILIGPTYVPGISDIGWSDIIRDDRGLEKVFGTIPSVSIMLFKIADEIVTEVIKVLLEDYSELRYKGVIYSENIFTGERDYIQSRRFPFEGENQKSNYILINVFTVLFAGLLAENNNLWYYLGYLLAIALPFVSYSSENKILKLSFINAAVYAVFIGRLLTHTITIPQNEILSSLSISMIMISMIGIINVFINRTVIGLIKTLSNPRKLSE